MDELLLGNLAGPFWDSIRPVVREFADRYNLRLVEWVHDQPLFDLGSVLYATADEYFAARKFDRVIQVYIDPRNVHSATVRIAVFCVIVEHDANGQIKNHRIRYLSIAKGELPRDAERMRAWLEVARAVREAVRESDLVDPEQFVAQSVKKGRYQDIPLFG